MNINWIQPGVEIKPGLEEGILELSYLPSIPMEVLFNSVLPQSKTDENERKWLIDESYSAINEIIKDPLTRKALFYNLHKSDLRVNCINLFHFTIRENKLHLYVFARSMNLKNMGYDLCTIDQVYRNAFEKLEKLYKVEIGKITIRINSLHYSIK